MFFSFMWKTNILSCQKFTVNKSFLISSKSGQHTRYTINNTWFPSLSQDEGQNVKLLVSKYLALQCVYNIPTYYNLYVLP